MRILDKVRASAEVLTRYDWKIWYFGDNVGFRGLICASRMLAIPRFMDFCYGIAKSWESAFEKWKKFDQTLPGAEILDLACSYNDEALKARMVRFAQWLSESPRHAGFYLTDDDYRSKLWVDTIAFHAPFLSKLASEENLNDYYQTALDFLLPNVAALKDSSHLFCHTYDVYLGETNKVHWARGQGWAIWGLYQTWTSVPDKIREKQNVRDILAETLNEVVKYQRDDGHWNTIVDDASSGVETSLAPFYVAIACEAVERGIVEKHAHIKHIEMAWNAVQEVWQENGIYGGVSADTLSGDAEYYRGIPIQECSPWAEGPPIIAAEVYHEFVSRNGE